MYVCLYKVKLIKNPNNDAVTIKITVKLCDL